MPDGFVFDEYAMDYVPMRVMLDCDHCQLLRRVEELEAERDAARAWARLWKRAAQFTRLDRTSYHWWYLRQEWTGMLRFAKRQSNFRVAARALGLPDAPTPDGE